MQNKQKTLNLLGLAQKAGKLATGFDAVKISLSKNQAKLIFIGNDVSQNTKDKLNFLIRKKYVKLVESFYSSEIKQAIGKERILVSVTDSGFSKAMIKNLNEGV